MISYELNESLANRYGGSPSEGFVKRAFEFQQLDEALQGVPEGSIDAECAVVYSDISGFSSLVAGSSPGEIKKFLDAYYAEILSRIYRHGGLVDQMFGDGIISVFSPELSPEMTGSVFHAGLNAAEAIVETFANTPYYSTKCALHKEQAVICQVGDDNYRQATIVGNIMTAVHRVESVAVDEAINMLLSIPEAAEMYRQARARTIVKRILKKDLTSNWQLTDFDTNLKGIDGGPHSILVAKFIS